MRRSTGPSVGARLTAGAGALQRFFRWPFAALRDEALVRLYASTGTRLSEVGRLDIDDVDMATESVRFTGEGSRDRRVRFGVRTARALSRHLRARVQHKSAELLNLWLADPSATAVEANGIKIRLKRLGRAAGRSPGMIGTRTGASRQSHSVMRTKNIRSMPSRCACVASATRAVRHPGRAASQWM